MVTNYGLQKVSDTEWYLLIEGYQPSDEFQITSNGSGPDQFYKVLASTTPGSTVLRPVRRRVEVAHVREAGNNAHVFVADAKGRYKVSATAVTALRGDDNTSPELDAKSQISRVIPSNATTQIEPLLVGANNVIIWFPAFGDRLLIWNGSATGQELSRLSFSMTNGMTLGRIGLTGVGTLTTSESSHCDGWDIYSV
ncbi:MAG: hypothetical protein R3C49_07290 [Planctomycetaceae bacterium]